MSKKTDKIIAVSAIVVAIASMVISVWQGIENRHHNRLTVTPKLGISFSMTDKKVGIVITNNGLGPAIMTKRTLKYKGKEIDDYQQEDIINVVKYLKMSGNLNFAILNNDEILSAGTEYPLLMLGIEGMPTLEMMEEIDSLVGFRLEYKSMYGEEFVVESGNYNEL